MAQNSIWHTEEKANNFMKHNSPVSQYERPRAVAFASSACVDKTTKIITEFTRKDLFTSETSKLSTAKGISMK